jgi:predicted branched-subunit amino acid permease
MSAAARPTRSRPATAVIRDSLGVGVAVGVSGVAFGVAGAAAHLTLWQTSALSALVFTGASQFALVGALAAGAAPGAAVAGALLLGVRNAFYGLQLARVLALPALLRPVAAHVVIDETTAVALAQPDRRSARLGFSVTAASLFVLWNLSTLAGAFGAREVADPDAWGLDAAGPAVFLALLAPRLRSGVNRTVAAAAVVLALTATVILPSGLPVLVALAAVPLGMVLFRGAHGEATQ